MNRKRILIFAMEKESQSQEAAHTLERRCPNPQVSPPLDLLGESGSCGSPAQFLPPGQRISSEPNAGVVLNRDLVGTVLIQKLGTRVDGTVGIVGCCKGRDACVTASRHSVRRQCWWVVLSCFTGL